MFIAEKAGRVKTWKDGVLYGQPLIDIRDEVADFNDRGLLGIAVDPDFTRNGFVYLAYIYDPPGAERDTDAPRYGRIVRYTVNGDLARPASARVILDDFKSETMQHGIGALRFAPDGALFASFGDGALSQGVQRLSLAAQMLDTIQGKLLRIDRNGNGLPDNPFFDARNPRSARSRIWAYGFRNPFRFGIHPESGLPYVADVGWNTYEWLVRATAGANFGWPCVEGNANTREYQAMPECAAVNPLSTAHKDLVYAHDGAPAAITGAAINSGDHFPAEFRGSLFYADYSKFFVRHATLDANGAIGATSDFVANVGEPVDLQFGRDGALYVLSHQSRGFQRIRVKNKPLAALAQPNVAAAQTGLRISGAGDHDTVAPGARLTLRSGNSATDWSVALYTGRRATQLARGNGAEIAFSVPAIFSETSRIEVLASAPLNAGSLDAARLTLHPPPTDGYIRSWYLLGNSIWSDLNTDRLGNEAAYSVTPADKRAWLMRNPTRNINLKAHITPSPGTFGVIADKASAYAFVWIDVPSERAGLLGMNSDDGVAVWLNGAEIWRNKVGRNMADDLRDIDLPAIRLKKGRNALLIKVDTYGGDWQFKARVLNADGSIMRDALPRTESSR